VTRAQVTCKRNLYQKLARNRTQQLCSVQLSSNTADQSNRIGASFWYKFLERVSPLLLSSAWAKWNSVSLSGSHSQLLCGNGWVSTGTRSIQFFLFECATDRWSGVGLHVQHHGQTRSTQTHLVGLLRRREVLKFTYNSVSDGKLIESESRDCVVWRADRTA